MKKILIILVALIGCGISANAQISQEERDKLNDSQKKIYDTQQKEINEKQKEAKEWKEVEKATNKADFDNRDIFDKPDKNYQFGNRARQLESDASKQQELLDNAARKGIENNEKKEVEKKETEKKEIEKKEVEKRDVEKKETEKED